MEKEFFLSGRSLTSGILRGSNESRGDRREGGSIIVRGGRRKNPLLLFVCPLPLGNVTQEKSCLILASKKIAKRCQGKGGGGHRP